MLIFAGLVASLVYFISMIALAKIAHLDLSKHTFSDLAKKKSASPAFRLTNRPSSPGCFFPYTWLLFVGF